MSKTATATRTTKAPPPAEATPAASPPSDAEALARALAEPFDPSEVEWKPKAVSGNRALAIAYVDARAIMDRLDRVLGVGNWGTTYRELPDGVVCRLRARARSEDEWFEHEDVGGFSDQPDKGDRLKAAFSDALKRVAVHLGIGRYLYRLPSQWVDYDPQRRQFIRTPTLPDFARPKAPAAKPQPAATGAVLVEQVKIREAELVARGVIADGQLAWQLHAFGEEQGYPKDVKTWDEAQVKAAQAVLKTWTTNREKDKARKTA